MEYYGSVVAVNENNTLVLNIFPESNLGLYLDNDIWLTEQVLLSERPSHYIEVGMQYFTNPYDSKLRLNQWFKLKLIESAEGDVIFYNSIIDGNETMMKLINIDFIDGRTNFGRKLHKKFSLDGVPDAEIEEIYNKLNGRDYHFLAIYNVGQGSCNAICDYRGKPQLYFDLGGGYRNESFTYPSNLQLCNCDSPTIVLSHWDGDHWLSIRKFPTFETSAWVVPRQKLSADALSTAEAIYIKGNLLIWPKNLHRLLFDFGEILKCNGKTINDSGLAVIYINDHRRFVRETLLPGDAKYKHIPFIEGKRFNNLVVTHHGGVNPTVVPLPKFYKSNYHIYSYGLNNSHGHPREATELLHSGAGWLKRFDTVHGHIGLHGRSCIINSHVILDGTNCNTIINKLTP